MLAHKIIVIGASAGGMQPLKTLVASLPADFPAAICIVMHIPAYAPSYLPDILSRIGPLPTLRPANGDAILPNHIYCATPDYHLLIEGGHFSVTKGPKENRVRPAIDTLFRSAAYSEGPNVIGVILSGLLDDGTSGLWTIKRLGGTTVIQDPEDAEYASMPQSALEKVEIDHIIPAAGLADLLTSFSTKPISKNPKANVSSDEQKRVAIEISIASSAHAFQKGVMAFGKVTPQTCPECGGILVQIKEGSFTRYRCHTGHAYTADTLLVSVTQAIEDKLWQTMRALEEASMLLEDTGKEFADIGNAKLAQEYFIKAAEVNARTKLIFQDIVENKPLCSKMILQDTKQNE